MNPEEIADVADDLSVENGATRLMTEAQLLLDEGMPPELLLEAMARTLGGLILATDDDDVQRSAWFGAAVNIMSDVFRSGMEREL